MSCVCGKSYIIKPNDTFFLIAERELGDRNDGGDSSNTHIVKQGENLSIIAEQYQVTLKALIDANPGINPRLIVVGQRINIPD